jgi:hypothetical protein
MRPCIPDLFNDQKTCFLSFFFSIPSLLDERTSHNLLTRLQMPREPVSPLVPLRYCGPSVDQPAWPYRAGLR